MIDLRLGRWQDVLADVTCDALVSDPPFSARTHAASTDRSDGSDASGLTPDYAPWTPADVHAFVSSWSPRVRGWMACLTDSDLSPHWRDAYEDAGRCSFAPVPCVISGMSVRMQGDGPSSESLSLLVARPRNLEFAKWGTLPGKYIGPAVRGSSKGRGKPPWLIEAIVRDYTRKGDLVVEPFGGWGSTFAACVAYGRRCVGAEMDKDAHAEAVRRLNRPLQVDMFGGAA